MFVPHHSVTGLFRPGPDSFEKLSVMSLWEVDVMDTVGRGVVRWDPEVTSKSGESDSVSLSVGG